MKRVVVAAIVAVIVFASPVFGAGLLYKSVAELEPDVAQAQQGVCPGDGSSIIKLWLVRPDSQYTVFLGEKRALFVDHATDVVYVTEVVDKKFVVKETTTFDAVKQRYERPCDYLAPDPKKGA